MSESSSVREAVDAVLNGSRGLEDLWSYQAQLLESLGPASKRFSAEDLAKPELRLALDLQQACMLLDPEDPSLAWNRAGLLADLGLFALAARDYLEAFARIRSISRDGDNSQALTDETDWAKDALVLAATCLSEAGSVVSAAAVGRLLAPRDLADVVVAIDRQLHSHTIE